MSKLVIVESPTKVKKIQQFLPAGYVVDSCVGHIRDLPSKKSEVPEAIKDKPWADYAVDVENDFQAHYITIRGKGKVITQLKKKLKDADELLLATDEDREGESIGWHLLEALKPKVPVRRMVFHEITKKAVLSALEAPRDLDMNLVQAQETRRILDRLYGYALSPLLWKKVGGNLSAGRVQSVAVRLVVERERDRRRFVPAEYWDLKAHLEHGKEFEARLVRVDGQRVAAGRDFDKETGKLTEGSDALVLDGPRAEDLAKRLRTTTWSVTDVQQRSGTSSPKPPFITSTLQQEANNRLDLGARDAMRVAQRLYENGFITYMRTDSTALSEEAVAGARAAVEQEFGAQFLPKSPRTYAGKKAKGAQEAHEAIRPSGETFQHPDRTGLSGKELALYRLIWQRTLACQMADERFTSTSVTLAAEEAEFQASGKYVDFPGWRAAWKAIRADEGALPDLEKGDTPALKELDAEGHETKPPARFTEASLVQALEKAGIGRPSTYASIIDTIQNRGYIAQKGKAMVPTFTAFAVVGLLEKNFPRLVDPEFTANMESVLDDIAAGDKEWVPFLRGWFLGPDGLQAEIDHRMETMDPETARIIDLGEGSDYVVRIGRFGPYVETEVDGERVSATIPEAITPDELTDDVIQQLLTAKVEGPKALGTDPKTGEPIYVLDGRYGPYYQLGEAEKGKKPPRASLPKGKTTADADLEEALFLLSLPRDVGPHPDGGRVVTNIGRFGPYVAHMPDDGKPDYRSIKDVAAVQHMNLEEALAVLAQPKGGRRGPKVLKELGKHPKDGTAVQVLDGRYGPYVKHGKLNASLPKGADPEALDMEGAIKLLDERKAKKR